MPLRTLQPRGDVRRTTRDAQQRALPEEMQQEAVVRPAPVPHGVLRGERAPLHGVVRALADMRLAPLRGVLPHGPLPALPAPRAGVRGPVPARAALPAPAAPLVPHRRVPPLRGAHHEAVLRRSRGGSKLL
ncbi:VQ motif-containing protein isoform 1, partial [Operophtera brumata]